MNQEALSQVAHHWEAILEGIKSGPRQATIGEAMRVSLHAVLAPVRNTTTISVLEASRYKVCLGFCQAFFCLALSEEGMVERNLSELGSGKDFFQWLESQRFLHGQRQVCPGTASMISELFDRFCGCLVVESTQSELEAVALQWVLALGTYQALARGEVSSEVLGAKLLYERQAPWLLPITLLPSRPPEHVYRLYSGGTAPQAIERMLRSPADEELFNSLYFSMRGPPRSSLE